MAVRIFFCYAHEDELFLEKLKSHLKPLQRQGLIEMWYDRDIRAGEVWEQEVTEQLNGAQIILLLLSADFMNSEFCYGHELTKALERHAKGEVQLIPVILRPVLWRNGPLGKLQALPIDGKPITSAHWSTIDEAFLTVAEGIHKVVSEQFLRVREPTEMVDQQDGRRSSGLLDVALQSPMEKSSELHGSEKFSLLRTLTGHALYVSSICMSSDERAFASGGGDGRVKLWDLSSGKLLHTFERHEGGVSSIAMSADGQTIVGGGKDGTVKVWETHSEKVLHVFDHPEESVSIAMSADGRMVASGGDDGQIKLWNLTSGRLVLTLEHHGGVSGVAMSADGRMMASGGGDGRVRLWNLTSGKIVRAPKGHEHRVYSIVMSSNGQLLASCGDDQKVKLWNISSGRLVRVLEQAIDSIYSIAMSANGQILASGTQEGTVRLRDVSTGELLSTIIGQSAILSIAIGFNGQRIIIGDGNGTIQIWGESNERSALGTIYS